MLRTPGSEDDTLENIIGGESSEDGEPGVSEQVSNEALEGPLSLVAPEGVEDDAVLPLGEAPGEGHGINVDLSQLTDEELAAFAADNPDAVRSQGMFQANHQQRSQVLSERERQLAAREQGIAQRETALSQLLERQAGSPDQYPSPGMPTGGTPQAPPLPAYPQPPQGQSQQVAPGSPSLANVQSVDELVQGLTQMVANQVQTAVGQPMQQVAQQMQLMQAQQLQRDVEGGFTDLAKSFPEVAKPEIRGQIEQVMATQGIVNPRTAYLTLLAPAIEQRQQAALAAQAEKRKAAPTPKAAAGGRKAKSRKEEAAEMTPAQKREAAVKIAAANPEAFQEDD